MTISSRKNHNIFALRGMEGYDDMDFVEIYGLDPSVAYTHEINTAAAEAQMKDNIANGMDEKEAKRVRDNHIRAANRLM